MFTKCTNCHGNKEIESFGFMMIKCPICLGAGEVFHNDELIINTSANTQCDNTVPAEGASPASAAQSSASSGAKAKASTSAKAKK